MKIFKYILFVISTIMMMTSCKEELDEFTLSDITITAQWAGDHPIYNVEYTNCTPEEVNEIGIKEKFIDNQWGKDWENERVIKLSTSNLTADDKYWTSYPGDAFEAFAYIICKNGRFRSQITKVNYPSVDTKITSATYTIYYAGYGELTIRGTGFKPKGASYRLASMGPIFTDKYHDYGITPTCIKIDGYPLKHTGVTKDTLYMNGIAMPFQFEVESASIKSVSSKSIEMGETITITIDGTTDRYNYSPDNMLISSMTESSYTLMPVVKKTGKVKLILKDEKLGINVDEAEINVHRTDWTSVLNKNNLLGSYMYDNLLYTIERKKITAYDCNTGKVKKTYTIDSKDYSYLDATINGDIMKVLWYDIDNGYRYMTTINLKNSKCEITPFYSEDYYFRFDKNIGIDNGYEYRYESQYNDNMKYEHIIQRRKVGSNSSWEEVGILEDIDARISRYDDSASRIPNTLLLVKNGWVYRSAYLADHYLIAYKTRLNSLKGKQETKPVGILSSKEEQTEYTEWHDQQMTTDGTNLYFKAIDINDQTILSKIELK